MYVLAETLKRTCKNVRVFYFENQVFVRDCYGKVTYVIKNFFQIHHAKIDFLIVMHFQSRIFWKLHRLGNRIFFTKVEGAKRFSK